MSGIEWTDSTWNPLVGCRWVSPGCDNCYAAREASGRLSGLPLYSGLAVGGEFTGEVRLVPERLDQPLRWKRPRRIFVNSMSDLFHPDVPDDFIAEVFSVMALADDHTFQVLTKRPQRMADLLDTDAFIDKVERAVVRRAEERQGFSRETLRLLKEDGWHTVIRCMLDWDRNLLWPLDNLWVGTSIENDRYTFRADHLRDTPAPVRFLSLEPLLGPVPSLDLTGIDWVIVGGESGPKARPMHPQWVRDIRDRCVAENVAFLFKQWGEWQPTPIFDAPGFVNGRAFKWPTGGATAVPDGRRGRLHCLDNDTMAIRIGKKIAGRELDGRLWDEYPD